METLKNKIDFAVVISVNHANPNGDPLNGNRPRVDYNNIGEISDVCIKRKIRNRLQDMGENIFVQSDDNKKDGYNSLSERFSKEIKMSKNKEEVSQAVCSKWIDVRAFGQVFAFKSTDKDGVSLGIRGPVSIMPAFSKNLISPTSIQITKSVNSEPAEKKSSDTMGMKNRVDFGLYVTYGSINCQLAAKTGFTQEDAEKIKSALATLFENDSSSARPEGSMEVVKLVWWKHNNASGQYSSAQVHRSFVVEAKEGITLPKSIDDFKFEIIPIPGLQAEYVESR